MIIAITSNDILCIERGRVKINYGSSMHSSLRDEGDLYVMTRRDLQAFGLKSYISIHRVLKVHKTMYHMHTCIYINP